MMPMVQQGQQPQRPAGRRAGGMQQPMPMGGQQQVFPRGGRGYRYPTGRGMPDPGMHSVGAVMPPSYEMGGMPMREAAPQPVPIGALATALANAPPDQQRLMLGENLYPLVEQLEREQAAKVTGMLLEMDQTEVLHLLESPDALKAKVAEAMEVLRSAQHLQQSNVSTEQQLANLSLNDGVVSS
nr:unknown [Zea mays]